MEPVREVLVQLCSPLEGCGLIALRYTDKHFYYFVAIPCLSKTMS